jgi:diadenosine tetraphosphate (Ap4A) HIT family hydrolase
VLRTPRLRVIRAEDGDFPAFYRVVWQDHVAEWSDLPAADQALLMAVVTAVERTLRAQLRPTKVNLASLGNVVPHLHWHVIARFDWDSRFPQPVWAPVQRVVEPTPETRLPLPLTRLDVAVAAAVSEALAVGRATDKGA